MKKGFTLVELIICITLIVLLGTGSTILVIKNKSNNELENLTKKVLEAANVYINIEKDENGIIYKSGILSGGKGIQLSVKNLVDKGYINNKIVKTLENETNKKQSDLYVLASLSVYENNDSFCGAGLVEFTNNWVDSEKPIYLCGYEKTTGGDSTGDDDESTESGESYEGNINDQEKMYNKGLFKKLISDYAVRKVEYQDYELLNNYDNNDTHSLSSETFSSSILNSNYSDTSIITNYAIVYDDIQNYHGESETPTYKFSAMIPEITTPVIRCMYNDKCYYANPNAKNYVKINDELFRILYITLPSSLRAETITLIKETSITATGKSNINEIKTHMYKEFKKFTNEKITISNSNKENQLKTIDETTTKFIGAPQLLNANDLMCYGIIYSEENNCKANEGFDICINNNSFLMSGGNTLTEGTLNFYAPNIYGEKKDFNIGEGNGKLTIFNDDIKNYYNNGNDSYNGGYSSSTSGNNRIRKGIFWSEEFTNEYRPVITIDISNVKWTGMGSKQSPYILDIDDLLTPNSIVY